MATLVWLSRDLRLADNPALAAALSRGKPVVLAYLRDDEDAGTWAPGAASQWWLHHSLTRFDASLSQRGSRLILRTGPAEREIVRLAKEAGANAVYWNRRYEPWALASRTRVATRLAAAGIEAKSFGADLLCEPHALRTQAGKPYTVFTPFRKAMTAALALDAPIPAPDRIPAPQAPPSSEELGSWRLLPRVPWDTGFKTAWTPGEDGAKARLTEFLDGAILSYADKRNIPGEPGTSRLSPHLHFGEISPRQIWRAAIAHGVAATGAPTPRGIETFLSEIAWREFSRHLLFHCPALPDEPLRKQFEAFPWRSDAAQLKAWRKGRTGVPIVDAGMRELWHTGWMHNRVRMIAASFLVKNLLIHWREGEAWFWETLVDADLANNAASWQWVAGCGADAAPFFRIFNPVTQGKTFDASGRYIRRWVPEIGRLPDERLHAPWTASPLELAEAGLRLGSDYPLPIVDHAATRARALAAHKALPRA